MRDATPTRRDVLGAGAGAMFAGLAGCTSSGGSGADTAATTAAGNAGDTGSSPDPASSPTAAASWREVELTDVTTGNAFTVADFAGQPVLLEFFAVWCPVCTEQQKQVGAALAQREDLVPISINTDPNEDADRVREHVDRHPEFDWRYAVAPTALTRSLIDQFGSIIANPPAAPVVRVCPDGSARLIDRRGAKPASDLLAAFESC